MLVALMACKSAVAPSPAPEQPDPPGPKTRHVTAKLADGWINVDIEIPLEPAGPRPVVITPIAPDREVLKLGIAVARFETNWESLKSFTAAKPTPAPEPARVGAWLLAAPRPEIVGRAYFQIITQEATHSLPKVVDYLTTVPGIDASRISIAGSSTSGFMALQAMAAEPRIAVGVVRVACGDYELFLRWSSLALAGDERWLPNGELKLDPDYAAELRQIEPIRHANRFPPRPLLLMVGDSDKAIPPQCSRATAAELTKAYTRAGVRERFRFLVFPEGHNLSTDAERFALDFWKHWLLDEKPTA